MMVKVLCPWDGFVPYPNATRWTVDKNGTLHVKQGNQTIASHNVSCWSMVTNQDVDEPHA